MAPPANEYDFIATGAQTNDQLGLDVAADDLSGDGKDDVFVEPPPGSWKEMRTSSSASPTGARPTWPTTITTSE